MAKLIKIRGVLILLCINVQTFYGQLKILHPSILIKIKNERNDLPTPSSAGGREFLSSAKFWQYQTRHRMRASARSFQQHRPAIHALLMDQN